MTINRTTWLIWLALALAVILLALGMWMTPGDVD